MKNDYSPGSGKQNICSWKCAPSALQISYIRNRHAIQAAVVLKTSRADTDTRRFSIENQMRL